MGTDGVYKDSTRAMLDRRRSSFKSAAAVAAVLFLVAIVTMVASRAVHSAASGQLEISSAPANPPRLAALGAAHDIAIETVPPGREGLELSARLTEDGGLIELPLDWTVVSSTGEEIYSASVPVADAAIGPGDYLIDVRYGAIHVTQSVTLVQGTRLIVSFVLDAGGIRILPKLRGLGLPAIASQSRIFALTGPNMGTLVATTSQPGEVLRVSAGDYRIESSFTRGNASAVTDVTVRAGIMSAVEIDHSAGLARLSFVGDPAADVLWRLVDDNGNTLPAIGGLSTEVVLTPGTYTAIAEIGGETLSANFAIGAGESRDIILGN